MDLERFVRVQDQRATPHPQEPANGGYPEGETEFQRAVRELEHGCKASHWMWFIFPQAFGLGSSPNSIFYAIKTPREALAYLAHPVLGPRLRRCTLIVLEAEWGEDDTQSFLERLFGSYLDFLKFRSCMSLFGWMTRAAEGEEGRFYYNVVMQTLGGRWCERTLEIIEGWEGENHGVVNGGSPARELGTGE